MSKFSSFLKKFVPEYKAIGEALGTIAIGVALPPHEREKVQAVIDTVQGAAERIEAGLGKVKEAEKMGIDKVALKAAMKEMLPDILGGLTETALRAALEAKTKTKAKAVTES